MENSPIRIFQLDVDLCWIRQGHDGGDARCVSVGERLQLFKRDGFVSVYTSWGHGFSFGLHGGKCTFDAIASHAIAPSLRLGSCPARAAGFPTSAALR